MIHRTLKLRPRPRGEAPGLWPATHFRLRTALCCVQPAARRASGLSHENSRWLPEPTAPQNANSRLVGQASGACALRNAKAALASQEPAPQDANPRLVLQASGACALQSAQAAMTSQKPASQNANPRRVCQGSGACVLPSAQAAMVSQMPSPLRQFWLLPHVDLAATPNLATGEVPVKPLAAVLARKLALSESQPLFSMYCALLKLDLAQLLQLSLLGPDP